MKVTKKCPNCGCQMEQEIDDSDKELFESLCRMWKPMVCDECSVVKDAMQRVEGAKAKLLSEIGSLEAKKQRLEKSVEAGWIEPESKSWINKWSAEISELRKQVNGLVMKESKLVGKYVKMKEKEEANG